MISKNDVEDLPKPSDAALSFLSNISESQLKCVLKKDKLSIVMRSGEETVGEYEMLIERDQYTSGDILRFKMISKAFIRCVTYGYEVTSKIDMKLSTIEESIHEYTVETNLLADRHTHLYKDFDVYALLKKYTEGNKKGDEYHSKIPAKNMFGFISESASILIMRLFVLNKIPENCIFIGLHSPSSTIVPITFEYITGVPKYLESFSQINGIRKILHLKKEQVIFDFWFTMDGKMVQREQVGSPLVGRLQMEELKAMTSEYSNNDEEKKETKKNEMQFCEGIGWQNDLMLLNNFYDLKNSLIFENSEYIEEAGVAELLGDLLQTLLLTKPADPIDTMIDFFRTHTSTEVRDDSRNDVIATGSREINIS